MKRADINAKIQAEKAKLAATTKKADKVEINTAIAELEAMEGDDDEPEAKAGEDTSGEIELNGKRYKVAARRVLPDRKSLYAKVTMKMKIMLEKSDSQVYPFTLIADGIDHYGNAKTLYFKYKEGLPTDLALLEAELKDGSKTMYILYKENNHIKGVTTFANDGVNLHHKETGWYAANIFDIVDEAMYQEAKASPLKGTVNKAMESHIARANAILDNMENYTSDQVKGAMAILSI